jgi:catechol 2,3-dioxygenase-like lactoylglutathione lyase family enzyme
MLSSLHVHPTIPASDLNRARRFYAEKLGFNPTREMPGGLIYECGGGSWFVLYPSQGAGTAQHTVAGWETGDIVADVAALKARGVVFEEYDLPNFKTVNSIATTGPARAAWFKDSEGNILGLVQLS